MKLKYSNIILCVIILFVSFSCQNSIPETKSGIETSEDIPLAKEFDWLIGTWIIESEESVMFEIWEVQNDSLISAHSYALQNGDTVFTEFLKIHLIEGDCYLTSAVSDQNDGEAVDFKLVKRDKSKLVFENLEHDFPQRIVYEGKSKNNLYAYIEGEVEGESHRVEFDFASVR